MTKDYIYTKSSKCLFIIIVSIFTVDLHYLDSEMLKTSQSEPQTAPTKTLLCLDQSADMRGLCPQLTDMMG